MTQSELAVACGITQTYLSQIENNTKEPNLSTLKEIGNNLEVPLPILFFLSLEEQDLLSSKAEAFRTLSPSVNKLINDYFPIQ